MMAGREQTEANNPYCYNRLIKDVKAFITRRFGTWQYRLLSRFHVCPHFLLYIVTTRHLTSFEFRDTHALPTEGGNGMENFKRGTCAAISAPPCFINWGGGRRDVMFEFFYKSILFVCWFLLFWKKFIEREKDLKLFVRVRIYIYIF